MNNQTLKILQQDSNRKMIKNNIHKNPQTSSGSVAQAKPKIVFEKQKLTKPKNRIQSKFNKENHSSFDNQQQIKSIDVVDLKKKIKKFPQMATVAKLRLVPYKTFEEDSALLGQMNGIPIFKDQALGFSDQFRNKIMPQRIDNDVYTDDEQIQSGINKLLGALQVAAAVNQKQEKEQLQKRSRQMTNKVQNIENESVSMQIEIVRQ